MNTHADKIQENKNQDVASSLPQLQSKGGTAFQFVDTRPEAIAQRKLQEAINNSPQVKQLRAYQEMANNFTSQTAQRKENREEETLQGKFEPIQKKENNTGLPDHLKSGIENLSGYSMNDVKVHYNSDKPAQLQAHAYAQGTDIHIAAGQEKHLPHEAWHVVQQKQGRVKPTMQMKGKLNVNDDAGLEKEADVMGANALQMKSIVTNHAVVTNSAAQRGNNYETNYGLLDSNKQTIQRTVVLHKGVKEDHFHILAAYNILNRSGILKELETIPNHVVEIRVTEAFTREGVIGGTSHYILKDKVSATISNPDIEAAFKKVGKPDKLYSIVQILADPDVYSKEGGNEFNDDVAVAQTLQTIVHEITLHALKIVELWPLIKEASITNEAWIKENEKGMPQSEEYQHAMAQDKENTKYIEINTQVENYLREHFSSAFANTYKTLWEGELDRFKKAYILQ